MSPVLAEVAAALDELFITIFSIAGGIVAGIMAVFSFWRVRSMVKVWRAPARPLQSVQAVIWRNPGDVSLLNLADGPGGVEGRPQPPFTFVEEHITGSQPCVSVRDGAGQRWRVKWGHEVNAEVLATRLAWAAGFFVETNYYIPEGTIVGASDGLQRASSCIDAAGRFTHARFELDERDVIKHFDEHSWSWADNPFVGTRELHGLKIVMMWLSNWDAKDVRDVARGSNTAIFEHISESRMHEARYLIIDWGGALGRWGSVVRRGRWDCHAFASENASFLTGRGDDTVFFGYTGQRTADIASGIRVNDVHWLLQTVGALSEAQVADAVRASGGTDEEALVFAQALRGRLDQLAAVTASVSPSDSPLSTRASAAP